MITTDPSLSSTSRPGWQLLGETELQARSNSETIASWLVGQLDPLNLHPDFVKQVLKSAHDATLRAVDSHTDTSFQHVHISIFAPNDLTAHGNTWGFFRIEKIDSTKLNDDHPNHAIEFYLYREGQ